MAHIISIPVSFEFRVTKINWMTCHAHVIGWRKAKDVQGDTSLLAEFANSGTTERFAFPVEWLPEDYRRRCLATLGKHSADEAVKEICSALELARFSHAQKTDFDPSELRKHSQKADAWQLRDEFLRLNVNSGATLSFLKEWGRWRQLPKSVDLTEIGGLQRRVRHALTSPPEQWFASSWASPPTLQARSKTFPYFTILTDSCEAAIRMTTTIDLLRQLKFKSCARPDCGVPFPVESKHERRYCTQYCAHLESVRQQRKVAAEAARERVLSQKTGTASRG
jgi:hypothetical protein